MNTAIYEKAMRGLPLDDVLMIDAHTHMGRWFNFDVKNGEAEGMLESMNRLGVNMACVAPHVAIGVDFHMGNKIIIDVLEKYPQRFIGYAVVNPNYADEMMPELESCFAKQGMRGIKLHPSCAGCAVDDPRFDAVYDYAGKNNRPVLIHIWGCGDVAAVERLSLAFPDTMFLMGHAGAEIAAMKKALALCATRKNVYADLALSTAYEGNVEWFVKEAGSRKILYGTDMPFFDPRPAFARVAMAEISDEEKRDVFGLNAKRLFGI